jgi:hypothetical protein
LAAGFFNSAFKFGATFRQDIVCGAGVAIIFPERPSQAGRLLDFGGAKTGGTQLAFSKTLTSPHGNAGPARL